MALVWAKQNGNWSDTTLWAFWNESTQQIEDYNQTPLADDVVYCNGHTINIVSGTYIISQIRNDVNPYTNIGGGFCKGPTTNSTIIFNAEIHSISKILSLSERSSLGCYFTLIGDIYCRNEYAIHIGTNSGRCTINGNIYGNYAADVQWNPALILNGNIYSENSALPIFYIRSLGGGSNVGRVTLNCNINDIFVFEINAQFRSLEINGNVTEDNYRMVNPTSNIISTLSISGDYTNKREQYYIVTDFIIGGSIYYIGTNNGLGVRYTNITILNPNTFVWKDVAEPRLNPFIILTDAEMNNRQQYPPENEVKEGTEYVWGEKVGTYQQPPEAVVLKDYVYDNGERTGTLENEVTINVGCTNPQDVRKDVPLANMGIVGTMVIPSPENVLEGTIYDNGTEGTLESQSTADYPAEDKVLIGTSYDHDNMTGSLEPGGDNPQESDVRFGVPYNHNLNIGKAHIPSSQDVRKNVPVEDTVGQIVIPRASEVKKDVEFDIDSVGTLESTVQTNNTINVYRKR